MHLADGIDVIYNRALNVYSLLKECTFNRIYYCTGCGRETGDYKNL
jgi:hypothetical protein